MSDFIRTFIDARIKFSGTSDQQKFEESLSEEFTKLHLEACRANPAVAREELKGGVQSSQSLEAQAPDLYYASLASTYFHQVFGREFEGINYADWFLRSGDLKAQYPMVESELDLLEEGLKLASRTLAVATKAGAERLVPYIKYLANKDITLFREVVDAAARLIEEYRPSRSAPLLGATKLRYFVPEKLFFPGGDRSEPRNQGSHIIHRDSYVRVASPVASAVLYDTVKLDQEFVAQFVKLDELTPSFDVWNYGMRIALLSELEPSNLGEALKTSKWAMLLPAGYHLEFELEADKGDPCLIAKAASETPKRSYWIFQASETYGPYTKDEIRQYANPDSLISHENSWVEFRVHPSFVQAES